MWLRRSFAMAGLAMAFALFTVQPVLTQSAGHPQLSSKCRFMIGNFENPKSAVSQKEPRALAMSANGRGCGWYVDGMAKPSSDPRGQALAECERNSSDQCEVIVCVGC